MCCSQTTAAPHGHGCSAAEDRDALDIPREIMARTPPVWPPGPLLLWPIASFPDGGRLHYQLCAPLPLHRARIARQKAEDFNIGGPLPPASPASLCL